MFCSQCGTNLEANAKFCSQCGHPAVGNHAPKFQETVAGNISTVVSPTTEHPKQIGTKWLKFWNYVSLPVGGILNLFFGYLMLLNFPLVGIIMIAIAIIQFAVVYGLHYRKLWAWQWNWVVIGVAYLGMLIPILPNGSSSGDMGVQFVVRLVVASLIWMWPNYVYWNKRGNLFSENINADLEDNKKILSQLLKLRSSENSYQAWVDLGDDYFSGQNVNQDYNKALQYYQKAADYGNAKAQFNIGVMYNNGQGLPQDYIQAVYWYRKAANQGYADAQCNLGQMYENGRGVVQDHQEAAKWYRLAADQGNVSAQTNLGRMYKDGLLLKNN